MIKSPNQSLNTIHRYVILFLIHAPAKGATLTWIMFLYLKKYFNPRSREGSDLFVAVKVWYPMKISIHAPAKGATIHTLRGYTICDISIHAPAKGATYLQITIPIRQQFQSTLPRRERRARTAHLPERLNFNPRSREGSDQALQIHPHHQSYFNPRSREGSDVWLPCKIFFRTYFNPRSREGSDDSPAADPVDVSISIHAPAKGATIPDEFRIVKPGISIHAPAKGATRSWQPEPQGY